MPYIISLDALEQPVTPPAIVAPAPAAGRAPGARFVPQAASAAVPSPAPAASPAASPLADALAAAYPGAQVQRIERPITREIKDAKGKIKQVQDVEVAYVLILQAPQPVVEAAPVQTVTAPTAIEYKLKGNTLLTTPEITYALRGLHTTDGDALARAVAGLYRAKGYMTVEAKAEGETITVIEGTSTVSGKYADYIAQAEVLGEEDMDGYKALAMRRAVRAQGELLDLRIAPRGMSRTGQAEVFVNGAPDPSLAPVATVAITNLGPRYSSQSLLTGAVTGTGAGIEYKLSGVTSLTSNEDSEGGYYRGLSATGMRPTPWGAYGIEASLASYKTGGEAVSLDMTGSSTKISLVSQHYLANGLTGELRLNHNRTTSELGAFETEDKVAYTSTSGTLLYAGRAGNLGIRADAQLEQGLGGTRNDAEIPLQGTVDTGFTTVSANVELGRHFDKLSGAGVSLKTGLQVGTDGTPSGAQFALGGPGRGSSYHSGVASAPSGGYVGLELDGPVSNFAGKSNVQPYIGLNTAIGKPTIGESIRLTSGEVGLRLALSEQLSGGVSYARHLDSNDHEREGRLNFHITGNF